MSYLRIPLGEYNKLLEMDSNIIDYIAFLRKSKSSASVMMYLAAIRKFYLMNDIYLNWDGRIEVTNTGSYVSTSVGNNFATNEGQGVISTEDGSEIASYSLIGTDNVTRDGKVTFRGSAAYSTNSTGNLSVLNNMVGFFKSEGDIKTGNFTSTEWELK